MWDAVCHAARSCQESQDPRSHFATSEAHQYRKKLVFLSDVPHRSQNGENASFLLMRQLRNFCRRWLRCCGRGSRQLRGMANSIPHFCGRIKCGSASSTGSQILLGCSPRSTNMAASGGSAGVPDILAGRSPQSGPHDGDGLQDAAKQQIQERLYMPILSALVPRNARLSSILCSH